MGGYGQMGGGGFPAMGQMGGGVTDKCRKWVKWGPIQHTVNPHKVGDTEPPPPCHKQEEHEQRPIKKVSRFIDSSTVIESYRISKLLIETTGYLLFDFKM